MIYKDIVKKAVECCKINKCSDCPFKSFPSKCMSVLMYKEKQRKGNGPMVLTNSGEKDRQKEDKSVYGILVWVIDSICNEYCKWPEQYSRDETKEGEAEDRLYDEHCAVCPFNRLV